MLNKPKKKSGKMKKRIRMFFVLLPLLLVSSGLMAQREIPDDFCISGTELKLYNLLNNHRKKNKLPEIPLSKSLCFVAKIHVNDLLNNKPDTADCNLHSWSDKGEWAECCYGREKFNNTCMTSKPVELTNYSGKGYEIAFWENVDADPEVVLDLWTSSQPSNDLILNKDIWKEKTWKAIGVGILAGYAVVWFGAETDPEQGVKICTNAENVSQKPIADKKQVTDTTSKTGEVKTASNEKWYLINASFDTREKAEKELQKYKASGFKSPAIVQSGNIYRVSLGTYNTREKALEVKKRLNPKYKDAWLHKQ